MDRHAFLLKGDILGHQKTAADDLLSYEKAPFLVAGVPCSVYSPGMSGQMVMRELHILS